MWGSFSRIYAISMYLFFTSEIILASVVLVQSSPNAFLDEWKKQQADLEAHFSPLIHEKKYEQCISEALTRGSAEEPSIINLVSRSGNIPFMRAYLEAVIKADMDSWNVQFSRACKRSDVIFADVLWEMRDMACLEDEEMWESLHEAIKRDDIVTVRWGVEALKKTGQLDLLNLKSRGTCIIQVYSTLRDRIESNPVTSSCLFNAAAILKRKDIMILLLQYGVDHTQGGHYPNEGTLGTNYSYNFKNIMKPFFLLKPRIIDLVLQSSDEPHWETRGNEKKPLGTYLNHLMAAMAFVKSPGLASEYIIDPKDGNNPLHCAVLAKNAKLIRLCLWANARLLESKNRFGETPLTLAYAKNLRTSLLTIIHAGSAILTTSK